MHYARRRRAALSAVPDESRSQRAVGADDQEVFCPAPLDALNSHLGDNITRAEIMNYLSQTYGPAFVQDLVKRLPQPDDGQKHMTKLSRNDTAQDGQRKTNYHNHAIPGVA